MFAGLELASRQNKHSWCWVLVFECRDADVQTDGNVREYRLNQWIKEINLISLFIWLARMTNSVKEW